MARKITISFKDTKKDKELFDKLMNMEDRSAEIKKILRNSICENTTNNDKKVDDILDFE